MILLRGKRLMCLITSLIFIMPSTLTPFQGQAMQISEKHTDNKEMVQVDRFGLLINPVQEQFEKDRIEFEKKKAEEQKKNEPQWQEFVLTYYSSLNSENGYGAITSQGKKLSRGGVANNVIPQNTKIYLEGYGQVTVNDKGSNKHFSVDNRLDVFIEREYGEGDREYSRRISKMGVKKVHGYIVK